MWTLDEWRQAIEELRLALGRPDPVRFDRFRAVFPGALYISRDDQLELRAYATIASVTTVARARILTPEGEIIPNRWDLVTTSDGAANTLRVNLAEGFLLSLVVEVSGASPQRGQLYAAARLFHGNATNIERAQALVDGYVTPETLLTWPEARSLAGPDTRRALVITTAAAPGAGNEHSFTIPTARRSRFQSLWMQLTTDATAVNRTVALVVDDGANELYRFPAVGTQAATLTDTYVAGPMGLDRATTLQVHSLAVPQDFWLRAGWRIRTVTTNLQAADAFGAARLVTEDQLDV